MLCGCKAMAAWRADSPYAVQQAVGDLLPRPWLLMLMVPPNLVANRNNALMFEVDCTTCKLELDKLVCTTTHPSPSKNPAKYSTPTPFRHFWHKVKFQIIKSNWQSVLPTRQLHVCRAIMTCNFLWCSSWHIRNSELHSPVLLGSNNTDRWPSLSNGSWTSYHSQPLTRHWWSNTPSKIQHGSSNGQLRNGLVAPGNRFSLRTNQCCENRSWSHWNLTLWLVTLSTWIQPYLLQGNSPLWYYHKLHVLNL